MHYCSVWYEYLICFLAGLQFHTIAVRCDRYQLIQLLVKATLLAYKDDSAIRYVQYPSVGAVLNIVYHVSGSAAIMMTDILEEYSRIARPMIPANIALLYGALLVDCLIDIVTAFSAFKEYLVRIQDWESAMKNLINRHLGEYGMHHWRFLFEDIKESHHTTSSVHFCDSNDKIGT